MNSGPLLIICDSSKIYHPKPKRTNKIINNKEVIRKYKSKKILKKNSLFLDSISLKEIENDFIEFSKIKNEQIEEEQNELYNLIKNCEHYKNQKNIRTKYNKSKNPLYNNIIDANGIESFI